jgi:small-conductance mechanosensitive channel
MKRPAIATALAVSVFSIHAFAQTPGAQPESMVAAIASAAASARTSDPPATLSFANRPIVELRATIMSRTPAARVETAEHTLKAITSAKPDAAVTTMATDQGTLISVDNRPVIVVFDADADALAGESMSSKAADAVGKLNVALREAAELRRPADLLRGAAVAIAITVLYVVLMWLLIRLEVRVASTLHNATERGLRRLPGGEVMVFVRAPRVVRWLLNVIGVLLGLLMTYAWLTAVLRRFPYTRPWGESLRSLLISTVTSLTSSVVEHIPDLLKILVIVLVVRFATKLVNFAFAAIEEGRLAVRGVYPETAQPTRRLIVGFLWLFALVVSYEYIPGSNTDAFKGVSVFVGIIISLGSTGVMNQLMSGMMVTYSRAVRVGDFVRIGDIEGTVVHLGGLSTKIRNARNEEITIPNAVVASNAAVNFSRHADSDGVFTPTSVTIGYDTPWRQVQALLLLAAERTSTVRREPKPVVLQTSLGDFYVNYTLLVCVENPNRRLATLNVLHANIQDAFNEFGVQIMSPNYEADPEGRKVVPPSQWFAAPAAPDPLKSGTHAEIGN